MDALDVGFIPMNPRLPGPLRFLQRIRYVRTLVTSLAYWVSLVRGIPRYDVVHAFSPSYWAFLLGPVPAMVAGRLLRRGVLLNYHSGEANDHLVRWPSTVTLSRLAHRIVVPSAYLQGVFEHHGLQAVAIHNFVEVDQIPFRLRRDPKPRFLSNRNLEPIYNVACSIRAFARIQSVVPEATLTIAGFGSERPRLEALAVALGLRNISFAGKVSPDGMGRLLDDADVLLNSPDVDNMPLSLIEAQAAGLPIASTKTGGIPVVVEDGVTGLLVPPGDDEALAAAGLRILRDPGLAIRLSESGRVACLARYTWEAVKDRWLLLYEEVAVGARQHLRSA